MVTITHAQEHDMEAIKRLADANKDTLGFLPRAVFQESLAKHWLLCAFLDEQVGGFVRYRHCRNKQTTVYDLCVARDLRRQGIGRALLTTLREEAQTQGQSHMQLKALMHIDANAFYAHYGFCCITTEAGRKQPLLVWRLAWT